MPNPNTKVMTSTGNNEWYTPNYVVNWAEERFGKFEHDVAATAINSVVLNSYYDEESNGLQQPWEGHVWCNPPYSKVGKKTEGGTSITDWLEKAVDAASKGARVTMLIPARVDTNWWQDNVPYAHAVLFIRGRIKFGGCKDPAPFPSAMLHFTKESVQLKHFNDHAYRVMGTAPRSLQRIEYITIPKL